MITIFHHDCSRTLDPQLHTHNVVCNATGDSEGNFKALENAAMCKAIQYCGRVYQNSLAMACRKLGYEIRETLDFRGNVKGFEIENVPEEILDRFSKRTNDIDEEIVRQERGSCKALNQDFIPFPNDENKEIQRSVIQEILQNKDRFMLLRGVAGSVGTTLRSFSSWHR